MKRIKPGPLSGHEWVLPVILALLRLGRQKQEEHEFVASLGYITRESQKQKQ